jgi:adenosylcobinamide-phosphate synthase
MPDRMLASTLAIAALALAIESALGYPAPLFRLLGHPVVWIGGLIGRLDRRLNRPTVPHARRRLNGALALLLILLVPVALALLAQAAALRLLPRPAALLLLGALASTLLASRSLHTHVAAVAGGLGRGLAGGRAAVSHIVGRDPSSLDEPGIVRAAIESLAENFADGVVAPLFWCALFGLPGIVAYKAINTADSMIGHLTPRHRDFGRAVARLDDLVNLPASRLASVWIVLAAATRHAADAARACKIVRRDARRHRSPNAGWPEAAMAGALSVRLAGPRVYGATRVDDAWMGDGDCPATIVDLVRALSLYRRACVIQLVAVLLFAAVIAVRQWG